MAPNKFGSVPSSWAFQLWARAMKEYAYWHPSIKNRLEDFGAKWTVGVRLACVRFAEFCMGRDLHLEKGLVVHMVVAAFLEGEAHALRGDAGLRRHRLEQVRTVALEVGVQLRQVARLSQHQCVGDH